MASCSRNADTTASGVSVMASPSSLAVSPVRTPDSRRKFVAGNDRDRSVMYRFGGRRRRNRASITGPDSIRRRSNQRCIVRGVRCRDCSRPDDGERRASLAQAREIRRVDCACQRDTRVARHPPPSRRQFWRRVSLIVGGGFMIEIALIGGQAARGVGSHFNRATALDTAIGAVMGRNDRHRDMLDRGSRHPGS